LSANESLWPENNFVRDAFKEDETEIKKSMNYIHENLSHHVNIKIQHSSSWAKLVRVMAWVIKLCSYTQTANNRKASFMVSDKENKMWCVDV